MMNSNYYYSASSNSFYDTSLFDIYKEADTWPDDCREVSDEVFGEFSVGVAPHGMLRGSDPEGLPKWVEAPEPSTEELINIVNEKKNSAMHLATIAIAPLQDAVDLADATSSEEALLTAWKQYRVALNRVTTQAGYPVAIDWPVVPVGYD